MALEQTIDPHLNSAATVSRMAGLVTVLDQQGQSRELQAGDQIQPGERIVVTPNSGVLLLLPDGNMLPVGHMPEVNSTMEGTVASLEDQPVKSVLTQGDDEALVAKSELGNETEPRRQQDDDQPVSSSITEESVIEMDLSQVNPDLSRSASNLAGMDFSEYDENHSYGKLAGSTATFQSQAPFVNFAPIIVGDSSGHTIEDTLLTSSGILRITDQNASDVATVSLASGKGACGIFSIDQQGHWAYQLNNNNPRVQALAEGEQLSEKFMVTVTDSHGASVDKEIVITVDGTNDKPVIAGVYSGDISEGSSQEVTGTLTQTDKDSTDSHRWSVDPATTAQHGSFSIDQNGQWHYKLDNTDPAVNTLAHGQQLTETINVKVADNHGGETTQQVTVTINGTNADPVIGGVFNGNAIEDKTTIISDKLTVIDTDATDTHSFGVDNPQGSYGRLSVDPNTGQWTYVLDHAKTDSLPDGAHRLETFNVSVVDNNGGRDSHQIIIDVAGSNDKPVITSIAAQSVNEGGADLQGQISSTDIDKGDTASYSTSYSHSGFSLNKDGSYRLDLTDKSFDHLAVGDQQKLLIPVTVTDSKGATDTQMLEITVHGTNDIPTINPVAATTVAEGSAVFSGQLSATDVDTTDTATYSTSSTQPGFSLKADGSYTIDPTNPVFDKLAVGQSQQLSIPVTVTDNNGGTSTTNIEVTITGTNDKPVIGSVAATTVAEGSAAFSGQLTATDVDTGDTFTYSATSTQPGFSLQPDGSYTIDPTDPAFDKLAVGQSQQLTIPVTVTDNHGATSTTNIEVTITGTNDKPVIGSVAATTIAEGSAAFSGQLTATDVDTGDTFTYSTTSTQSGFSLQPDGSYTVDPTDPVFDKLAAGQSQVLSIPVTVADNNGGTSTTNIEVTITGTNDKAVISSTMVSVTEDTHQSASIQLGITDVDAGEANFQAGSISGAHGTATLTTDGSLTYKLDNAAAQHLNAGQSITDTITVKSADGTTHDVAVTINGTNDKPVINAITAQSANEDGSKVTGTITSSDVDTGDTATYATTATQAGFTLNKDGSYSLDPTDPSFQHLAVGETQVVTIPVIATDKHGGDSASQNIVITITGTNDNPVVSAPVVLPAGTEDLTQTITSAQLLANTMDVDSSDKLSVSNVNVDHGSVTIDSAGTLHFTPQPDYNGKVTFSYDVIDGHGGVVSTSASTDLAAVQDAATITSSTVDVTEDTHQTAKITLGIIDPDAGEAKFQAGTLKGAHGSATLTEAGELVYSLDNAAAQQLNVGQSITDTIAVKSADGTTHDVSVTINGTNDKPVINAITAQSANEDGSKVTGAITSSDVDTGDTASYATTATQAGFTLNSDGSYSLDPTDSSFQHLAVGETQTIKIPVTATDSHGGVSAVSDLVITVTGTNDIPVVSAPVVLPAGTEDLTQTITSAQLLANAKDVDSSDKLSVDNVNVDHGSVTIDSAGTLHFTPQPDYNGKVTFSYDVIDGHGGVVSTSASTDLAAVQDAATITSTTVDVTEDTHTRAQITLGITDPDAGEAKFQASTLKGAHGSATLTEAGELVYTLDNAAAQQLNVGQSITDTITVKSADGTTHDVAVTINGTNDKPVINAITAQSVNEDGSKVTGTITSSDVDTGDTATYATTSTQAGFTLNSDGSYSLDPSNAAYQSLAVGETMKLSISVVATDTHTGVSAPQNLVITVTGTNDIPVVSAPVVLPAGTEDLTQTITASQLLANATDIDTKDVLSISGAVTADHGTVSGPDASGAYHFTPAPDYNGAVTFSYAVTDSNGGTVATSATTTLAAVDDLIVDSGARDLGATDEDKAQHISEAQLLQNLHDVDGSLSVVGTPTSAHGTVTVDPAGGFIFTPAANYHGPAELSYQVTDGATQYTKTASLDVSSVTDAAKLDLSMTAEQTIVKYDPTQVKPGEVPYIEQTVSKQAYREFTFEMTFVGSKSIPDKANLAGLQNGDPLGVWDPKNLSVSLGGSQHRAGIHLNDGQDHRVTVTWQSQSGELNIYDNGKLAGTWNNVLKGQVFNGGDKWIVGATTHSSGSLNSEITSFNFASKAVSASEVASAPLHDVLNGDASMQTDIRAVGGVITDLASSHQPVSTVTVEQKIIDVQTMIPNPGALLHITPSAVATAPDDKLSKLEIGGFIKGTVLTDGQGNSHTVTGMSDKVEIQNWNLNSLSAQLPQGVTQNMNITLIATTVAPDGKEAVATTNEAVTLDPASPIPDAQISGDDNKATDEDHSVAGILHVTDSDASQAHFDTTPVNGKYGQLTITADGHWVFTPNAAANALNEGDKVNDILSVKSADGTTHQVIINITGSNDAPVISNVVNQSAIEDGKLLSGHLVATDADSGDSLTFSAGKAGLPPGMTLDSQGNYSLDPSHAVFQHLAAGEIRTLVVPVQVTDSQGATDTTNITIVVTGTNDIPTLTVVPDTGNPQIGSLQGTDVDTTDTLSYSVVNANGQFGSLSIDPTTHQYSYTQAQTVAGMNYDKATQTYSGRDVFEVKVSDGKGGESSQFISFDVNGQVSAPTPGNPGVPVVQTSTTTATVGNTAPPVTTVPAGAGTNAVTIDLVAGSDSGQSATDNITKDSTPTITGQTDIPFSKVEIVEGGKVIATTTSDASGQYSVTTPMLTDANHDLIAQATAPSAGTPVSSSALNIVVDTQIDTGTIDITDGGNVDGIINLQEAGNAKISGRIDVSASLDSLEITDASGNKVTVPAASVSVDPATGQYVTTVDVSSLSDGKLTVTAIATDTAGNTASVTDNIVLDTFVPPAINPANIAFPTLGNNPTPTLTVTTPAGLPPGSQVQVTIPPAIAGGTPTVVTGSVPAGGGPVAITLPTLPQGTTTPSVSLVTPSGNSTAPVTASITVDTTPPSISIDAIDTDNVINAAEHKRDLTITGKTDAEVGQEVTVNVVGTDYKGSVAAGGIFSVTVPASTVAAFTDGQTLSVSANVSDKAGNSATPVTANVSVDTTAQLSIDAISTDNVINSAEHKQPLTVSGTVTGVENGETVTVAVGVNTYTATVTNGTFTVTVPVTDVQALATGSSTVAATVTDQAGNIANAVHPVTITDTYSGAAATVGITDGGNTDNIINAAEKTAAVVTGSIDPGATLTELKITDSAGTTHTVDLKPGQVTVDTNGNYSVHNVDVSSLTDGTLTVEAVATDSVGNTSTATDSINLDTATPPALPAGAITAPAITNNTAPTITVNVPTGTVPAGTTIQTTIPATTPGGQPTVISTAVPANGGPVTVQLPTLPQGTTTPTVQLVTPSGNTSPAVTAPAVTVDTTPPTISIDAIDTDNVINAAEHKTDLTITGKTDAEVGQEVTVNVAGTDYKGSVVAGGTFSVTVPVATVVNFTDGQHLAITAKVTDAAGNDANPASAAVAVDLNATATITVDSVTTDNVINAAESGGKVNVTGSVSGDVKDGDTVTLTVNGKDITGTVSGGQYSIAIDGSDLKADSNVHASVTATDTAGNTQTAATDHTYSVDTSINAGITFDNITTDNIVNAAEAGRTVTVTGTVSGDVKDGDTVTVSASGYRHTGIVSGGTFAIDVPGNELQHGRHVNAAVTTTDAAGNSATATAAHNYSVDLKATAGVSVDSITPDNVINAAESGGKVNVTGSVSGDVKDGDTVTLIVNGNAVTGTVAGGKYTIPVDGSDLKTDSNVHASVTATDAAGNTQSATVDHSYSVDTAISATITLDNITTDNIVNATEAGSTVPVTGSVGGDAHAGDTVTITVGSATHTGTVDASGNFSINVPGSELQGATSVGASVTTTDAAGNTATAAGTQNYSVDTTATASLTVDSITPDNVINAAESGAKVNVTGTVGGDVKDGDTVILTINGKDISGTVSGGQYSIAVDGADLKADSSVKASVTTTDAAGNTQSASVDHNYDVDTTALSKPHIETTTDTDGDGWINIAELARDGGRTFTLKVDIPTDAKVGDAVLFPGEGVKDIVLTQTDMNRGFVTAQLTVPPGLDVSGNNAWIELDAQLRDAAGNLSPIATIRTNVDTVVGEPKITFESAGADGIYSASEVGADKTITAKIHLPVDAKLGDYLSINGVEQRVSPLANRDNTITTEVKPGETLTVVFRDQHGNVSKPVTATAATADTTASATDDSGDVTEDKTGVASGNVLGNDADAASVTTTGDIAGKYGTFHFNSDGSYTYTLDNSNPVVQKLAPSSAPLLDSVPYTAVDDHGNTVTANLNINIHGLIDAPALTTSHEAITFNPIDAIADGRLGNTNVDLTAFNVSGRSIENAQGHLDLGKADATLVHRSSTAIGISDKATVGNTQFVNTDETLLIQLQGESRSALITLGGFASKSTSTGRFAGRSDDRMHWVAYDHNGVKVDEGNYDPKATDVGSTSTAVITTSSPYTYLAIQAQHNPDPNVGEARFTVNHVEAPLIAYETKVNFNGVLGDDTNSGETLSYKVTGLDVLSGFNHGTKNPDGSWTISAKDAADLRVHHVGALDLTVQAIATDGAASANSSQVALHIDGATGAQYELISGVHSGATTEDGLKPVQGDLGIDTTAPGQHEFVTQTTTSKYGTFTLDTSGHWTYQVNQSGTQSLGKGDMQHEVFTVVTNNGVSREVTVDIRGIDDASVVGGRVGSVTEDKTGQTQVGDKMTVTDIDSDVSTLGFKSVTEQGSYGDLTIRSDGSWTYTLDPAKADSLAAGDIAHESFSIPLIDTTTGRGLSRYQGPSPTDDKIEITINGTNDAAVIGGVDQASTREGDTTAVGGSLTVSDADHDQDSFTVVNNQAGDKGYGSFSVDANGQWSYKLDNNNAGVRALNASDKATDSIVVHSADGTAHTISVEITGQDNQAPSLQAGSVTLDEDQLHFFKASEFGYQDADGDSLHHITIEEAPKDGFLTLDSKPVQVGQQIAAADLGRLIFIPLGNDSGQDYASFKITASDGQTDSAPVVISLNVNAINDAPVVEKSSVLVDSVDEDGATDRASGHIDVTDVDGDSLSYNIDPANQPRFGSLSVDSQGQWSYTLDNSNARVDALNNGQSLTDYAKVQVSDGHGGMVERDVSIVINGSDDNHAAVISGADGGSVTEDGKLSIAGQLDVTDQDGAAEELLQAQTQQGQYGDFKVYADGYWEYHLNNQSATVQNLTSSDNKQDTITVKSVDGTPHVITVDIQGADESHAPVISAFSGSTSWRRPYQWTGQVDATDVDRGDRLDYDLPNGRYGRGGSVTSRGSYGVLTLESNGDLTYRVNSRLNTSGMDHPHGRGNNDREGREYFEVQVTDKQGNTDTKYIEFVVHSRGDGKDGYVYSQTETDSPPRWANINDEVQTDNALLAEQINIDLADSHQQIAAAEHEINVLAAQGADTSEVQAQLDEFTAIRESLREELTVLESDAPQVTLHEQHSDTGATVTDADATDADTTDKAAMLDAASDVDENGSVHHDEPAPDTDLAALVAGEETTLDFTHLPDPSLQTAAEATVIEHEASPLNAGDVLDNEQDADILNAVDKLDTAKPDTVDKGDVADKADTDISADQHDAPGAAPDEQPDVMPDRAALDAQLVEPPDEHQQ